MKRVVIVLLATVLLVSGCGGHGTKGGPAPSGGASGGVPAGPIGPAAIFGLSVRLPDAAEELADQVTVLRSWRVPLIRLDISDAVPADTLTTALAAVRDAGARPVVAMPNTGVDPARLIDRIRQVFTEGPVYLEYADPETWNKVAPQLRRDEGVKLVARVNPADPAGVAGFVSFAAPRPDFLSWTRYACQPTDSDSACERAPSSWHNGIDAVSSAVRAAIGTPIPFFFTEWNLDRSADPRYQRNDFVGPWTRGALTTLFGLVPDGLAGAMIEAPTGGSLGLIENGHVTAQGAVFRDMLSTASPTPSVNATPDAGASSTAPIGRPTATPRSPSAPPAPVKTHMSFESSTDNWVKYWNNEHITALSRTTSQHYAGSAALLMRTDAVGDIAIGCSHGLTGLHQGSRVVYHVWTDGKAKGNVAGFVQDSSRKSYFPRAPIPIPAKAGWFTVTFTVPEVKPFAIGLQLSPTQTGASIMLDAVGWST